MQLVKCVFVLSLQLNSGLLKDTKLEGGLRGKLTELNIRSSGKGKYLSVKS